MPRDARDNLWCGKSNRQKWRMDFTTTDWLSPEIKRRRAESRASSAWLLKRLAVVPTNYHLR